MRIPAALALRRRLRLAALAAAALAGCAAPDFPEQARYPFGLSQAIDAAQRGLDAATDPRDIAARTQALAMVRRQRCPDWRDARLRHPVDALTGNPMPQDAVALGCSNLAALDAMVARRDDLTDPPRAMAPAPAAGVARGSAAYRTTGPAPLPQRDGVVGGL